MSTPCQQQQTPARPTATDIETKGLAELVALARCAPQGPGPTAERCNQPATSEKHIFAIKRGDLVLSAAAADFDDDSPIATSQSHTPAEEVHGSSPRKVHHHYFLEQFHMEARLRDVRHARRQKLQS